MRSLAGPTHLQCKRMLPSLILQAMRHLTVGKESQHAASARDTQMRVREPVGLA